MKIMVPFADGFEEIEAITNIDVLRRAEINVITISLEKKIVEGAHNIEFITEGNINDVDITQLEGIVLPGGMPGAVNLRDDKKIIDIVKELYKNNKLIGAICAAPIVLEKAGIINDKKVTSYPGFENKLKSCEYKSDRVVIDGNIITGRGPGTALEFALSIVRYLKNDKISEQIRKDMIANFKIVIFRREECNLRHTCPILSVTRSQL